MKKRIAMLVAGLGLAGLLAPFGSTSANADPACLQGGVVPPQAGFCVDREPPDVTITAQKLVLAPPGCYLVACTGEIALEGYNVVVTDHNLVVLWSAGLQKCVIVGDSGLVTVKPNVSDPSGC